jgi:hypothetical protein
MQTFLFQYLQDTSSTRSTIDGVGGVDAEASFGRVVVGKWECETRTGGNARVDHIAESAHG